MSEIEEDKVMNEESDARKQPSDAWLSGLATACLFGMTLPHPVASAAVTGVGCGGVGGWAYMAYRRMASPNAHPSASIEHREIFKGWLVATAAILVSSAIVSLRSPTGGLGGLVAAALAIGVALAHYRVSLLRAAGDR